MLLLEGTKPEMEAMTENFGQRGRTSGIKDMLGILTGGIREDNQP
jgi:hypothetical protein